MISALHNEINGENNISIINAYFQLLWHRLMPNLHMKPLPLATISNMATIIITYISTHFHEPISLEILSDTFAVNKSYISRIFSQIFHISFPKYVNTIRVEHAKKLLLQSKVNITDIAIQCGYQNVPSFNRAFKNICGMTPSAYRQAPPL